MAVVTMKKLSLVATKPDTDKLIKKLMWISGVEVGEFNFDETELPQKINTEFEAERQATEQRISCLEKAIEILKPYDMSKGGLFAKKPQVDKSLFDQMAGTKEALELSNEVIKTSEELIFLNSELKKTKDKIVFLEAWTLSDTPLDFSGTKETGHIFGTLPISSSIESVAEEISDITTDFYIEEVNRDKIARYVSVHYLNDADDDVIGTLSSLGFMKVDFSESGTALEARQRCLDLDLEIKKRIEETENRLKEASKQTKLLKTAYDIEKSELERIKAKLKLLCTESAVILTGWVPEKEISRFEEQVKDVFCYYRFDEPDEGDDVPVLLENNKIAEPFEEVIGMFSLPAYKTFDPTAIMSIFYFIIFGLMLGDFVYGLILTLGGMFLLKKAELSGSAKKLVKMFAICGISCMISGIIFGSYLGNLPSMINEKMLGGKPLVTYIYIDIMEEPLKFLIVSIIAGIAHLLCGLAIKFYILCKQGDVFAAIFDIGSWFVIFAGAGIALGIKKQIGIYIALAGVIMIILTAGREKKNIFAKFFGGLLGLYNIVGYMSDLLSYSRIMALGLASAVIAMVVNILATLMGPSFFGWIFMIVVLIVGHTANLAINVLGSFVHTSRLQYIEFFGKFYEDGGRPFEPLAPNTTYVKVK